METTPGWLNSLQLKRFSASRNLIIDIDPDFPWQLTALDGYGANLTLVTDHKWGVWSGSANLNAAAATFNRVDVRRPSLALTANSSTVNISELSAFTEKGILEATASVSQTPQRQTHISLNGRGVPVNILQQWGWPELPLTGDGNIQLTASGDIQANIPLKPTVSGQLHAVNATKQQVTQTMNAGVVSSGEVTSTGGAVNTRALTDINVSVPAITAKQHTHYTITISPVHLLLSPENVLPAQENGYHVGHHLPSKFPSREQTLFPPRSDDTDAAAGKCPAPALAPAFHQVSRHAADHQHSR